MNATVVHLSNALVERQLDKPVAQLLQKTPGAGGLCFLLGVHATELLGTDHVTAVHFKDSTQIPANLMVMAAGVRPNIELIRIAGLCCERAVIVGDTLQTYDSHICAVSECVQHRSATFGLVAPVWSQARVCVAHSAGAGRRRYVQQTTTTRLKVTGVDLYSAGGFVDSDSTKNIVLRGLCRGVYKHLMPKEDCIVGTILYGDITDSPWHLDPVRCRVPIASVRQRLLFGRAFCGAGAA